MHSKQKGNISEARALYEFQRLEIPVLVPWGDNERYDMVIDLAGKLCRVQVKTANEETNGSISCYCRSSINKTTNKKLSTYENDIDFFVFFNQKYDKIALVPIEEIGGNTQQIRLRVTPTKNGMVKGIRFFDDFTFEKTLAKYICPCDATG